ncbi:MAG: creatininase family protein [Desulfobacteraceae bacterium]|nr:creatininase family protein [Desulfobacteraceae bacterium]
MDVLVAPTLCYGISPHHMAFKGTITLGTDTLIAIISDVTRSLVAHGFKRIVFINGHGGNTNAVMAALTRMKAENLPGLFKLISWYELEEVEAVTKSLFKDQEGQHATPGEVSITRYVRPDEFDNKPTEVVPVDNPDYYWPLTPAEMRRVFPDGRMNSAPWLASADHGKILVKTAVTAIQQQIERLSEMEIY